MTRKDFIISPSGINNRSSFPKDTHTARRDPAGDSQPKQQFTLFDPREAVGKAQGAMDLPLRPPIPPKNADNN